jgi:hypothetical protein
MTLATPQLTKNVLSLTEKYNNLEKALISPKPILILQPNLHTNSQADVQARFHLFHFQ